MSRFMSNKYAALKPYTPGEQPKGRQFIKLNTNESPFPPSPLAQKYAAEEMKQLKLYSDPCCTTLAERAAQVLGIDQEELLFTNGSDDALNFAFMAFCDREHPAIFPDISYGFYKVFAQLNNIPYRELPLKEDFTIDIRDYCDAEGTVFIANPNAPTGLCLSLKDIETIVQSNPDRVVVIDEAYVDFGGESAISLIHKYDNLLVVQTFSKSRSMAGARLGFAAGCKSLIADLNTLKFSTNPYNVNRMTMAAGVGSLEDAEYFHSCVDRVKACRRWTRQQLELLGMTTLDSSTNFVFTKHSNLPGKVLYTKLRDRGILIRHFDTPRLTDFIRVTIGDEQQMAAFITALKEILEETV
jgi:histidinol-phosphate aminotransferase